MPDGTVRGPAPRPCSSCPYRCGVPSGIWSGDDYAKLPSYDAPTPEQPPGLFLCHQSDGDDPTARMCAGWVGCHGGELLALRLAAVHGSVTEPELAVAFNHAEVVPLFASGAAAAEHGLRDIAGPGLQAREMMSKIARRRPDALGD